MNIEPINKIKLYSKAVTEFTGIFVILFFSFLNDTFIFFHFLVVNMHNIKFTFTFTFSSSQTGTLYPLNTNSPLFPLYLVLGTAGHYFLNQKTLKRSNSSLWNKLMVRSPTS